MPDLDDLELDRLLRQAAQDLATQYESNADRLMADSNAPLDPAIEASITRRISAAVQHIKRPLAHYMRWVASLAAALLVGGSIMVMQTEGWSKLKQYVLERFDTHTEIHTQSADDPALREMLEGERAIFVQWLPTIIPEGFSIEEQTIYAHMALTHYTRGTQSIDLLQHDVSGNSGMGAALDTENALTENLIVHNLEVFYIEKAIGEHIYRTCTFSFDDYFFILSTCDLAREEILALVETLAPIS
ncbi:MAG: DUF4367 domain-containing protein [Oscillospiraceae bacterium]